MSRRTHYSDDELKAILKRFAELLQTESDHESSGSASGSDTAEEVDMQVEDLLALDSGRQARFFDTSDLALADIPDAIAQVASVNTFVGLLKQTQLKHNKTSDNVYKVDDLGHKAFRRSALNVNPVKGFTQTLVEAIIEEYFEYDPKLNRLLPNKDFIALIGIEPDQASLLTREACIQLISSYLQKVLFVSFGAHLQARVVEGEESQTEAMTVAESSDLIAAVLPDDATEEEKAEFLDDLWVATARERNNATGSESTIISDVFIANEQAQRVAHPVNDFVWLAQQNESFLQRVRDNSFAGDHQGETNKLLIAAIKANRVYAVRYLLSVGAYPNAIDTGINGDRCDALMLAIRTGNSAIVHALIDASDRADDAQKINFSYRQETKRISIPEGEFDSDSDSDDEDERDTFKTVIDRRTALMIAIEEGYQDRETFSLIAGRSSLSDKDGVINALMSQFTDDETALIKAARSEHSMYLEEILEVDISSAHPTLETPDKKGQTPLMHAASAGCKENIERLLWHGAEIDAVDPHHNTALIYAASEGHAAVAETLIQAGALVEGRRLDVRSPLTIAVKKGHLSVVKTLVKHGADYKKAKRNRNAIPAQKEKCKEVDHFLKCKAQYDKNAAVLEVLTKILTADVLETFQHADLAEDSLNQKFLDVLDEWKVKPFNPEKPFEGIKDQRALFSELQKTARLKQWLSKNTSSFFSFGCSRTKSSDNFSRFCDAMMRSNSLDELNKQPEFGVLTALLPELDSQVRVDAAVARAESAETVAQTFRALMPTLDAIHNEKKQIRDSISFMQTLHASSSPDDFRTKAEYEQHVSEHEESQRVNYQALGVLNKQLSSVITVDQSYSQVVAEKEKVQIEKVEFDGLGEESTVIDQLVKVRRIETHADVAEAAACDVMSEFARQTVGFLHTVKSSSNLIGGADVMAAIDSALLLLQDMQALPLDVQLQSLSDALLIVESSVLLSNPVLSVGPRSNLVQVKGRVEVIREAVETAYTALQGEATVVADAVDDIAAASVVP